MAWECTTNSDQNMIEVKYTGHVTNEDLHESTSKVISMEKETDIHSILSDTSEAVLDASLPEIFDIPTKQYVEEHADYRGNLAIILSESPKERNAAEFFSAISQSAGWHVNTFDNRQLAINWLKSSR